MQMNFISIDSIIKKKKKKNNAIKSSSPKIPNDSSIDPIMISFSG